MRSAAWLSLALAAALTGVQARDRIDPDVSLLAAAARSGWQHRSQQVAVHVVLDGHGADTSALPPATDALDADRAAPVVEAGTLPAVDAGVDTGVEDVAAPPSSSDRIPLRIAVIGAGAAGSHAAYAIAQALGKDSGRYAPVPRHPQVHVYEAAAMLGGRARTALIPGPGGDMDTATTVSLGAAIFLKENPLLYNAVREFGLPLSTEPHPGDGHEADSDDGRFGIWDGAQWRFRTAETDWQTNWQFLWRYGYLPYRRATALARAVAAQFTTGVQALLDPAADDDTSVTTTAAYAERLGLRAPAQVSGTAFFHAHGVGDPFASEIVQSLVRVNYCQNLDAANALGGLVSLAAMTGEATSVVGGNERIFDAWIRASHASLRLNTTVHAIDRVPAEGPTLRPQYRLTTSEPTGATWSGVYDAVIVATPFWSSGLRLDPAIVPDAAATIPNTPYQPVEATFVVGVLNHTFFGFASTDEVPTTILTVPREDGGPSAFHSLSVLRRYPDDVVLAKVFSVAPLDVAALFVTTSVVYVKSWHAYPQLRPDQPLAPFELAPGLYYASAAEPLFSTMESQAAAGGFAAKLALQHLQRTMSQSSV
ncbi:hypothetical protein CXG81DRAFT_18531 [Caulochytrium protostelioides]|uniref:Prenylcysteine lyase domain-containing protein n=1 Tax=Caulochytrium protostelioides TaxID=1555241 RepID=A0A4P9X8S3_9FUNG|nr:hypothetical protein CXG81DRAFT_18531 [Caulochytrium protostelioides]|eukprot:RKP01713.1 hypothetical protein CXG81DRAFT_18531 [Caulochytrium protostelioides]